MASRLSEDGWLVLARNWHGDGAELDLVVARAGQLRFVEVKARVPGDEGALESITRDKRRRLTRAAEAWMDLHGEPTVDASFVVAVVTMAGDDWPIAWLVDPFDAEP